ncbi:ribonuclease H-like domain-containing protein [Tanacetum coccineum]
MAPTNQENRNRENTRRVMPVETTTSNDLISCDGLGDYDWSDQSEECLTNLHSRVTLLQVLTLRTSKINDITYKTGLEFVEARLLVYKKNKSVYDEDIKLLKHEIHLREVAITVLRRKLELAQKQKDEIQLIVEKYENSSKSLSKLIDCQIVDKCKTGLGYNVVPPPYTGNFMPPKPDLSFSGLEEFMNEPIVDKPKVVKKNNGAPIIEDWVSDSEEEDMHSAKDSKRKIGNPQQDLEEKGVIDSGCSRHMTGNMSYLTDFKEIDGGYVAFGGNPKGGKITGRDDYSRFSWVFFLATKDETSGILKSFITGVENLIDQRVKVIRCDNGTEFKNKEMNQFCERKGIKREFSVARTPQQNGVAERKNRTLIEAARTMLADSKLPTTFWAEAVNTACYVQNRVLVTKPHNKTPYELFLGRKPALGFMRPFGCPVTILNTIDHLGKFDGKADEGFFVGYSINRSRPNWLFYIDALTKSMNYKLVVAGNQSNGNVGTKACDDAGKMEIVNGKDHVLLPLWPANPLFSQSSKSSLDAKFKPSGDDKKKVTEELGKEDGDLSKKDESNDQEKDDNVNSTNNVNAASTNKVNVVDDDEDVGAEADMNNLNTFMPVIPIPTTRIHKDHPDEQIIRHLNSAPQTNE